jgi:predicted enzyme related to lactoylglutathione lyase
MLRGFTTVNYWVDDMEAAIKWYSELLGIEPYFVRSDDQGPAYVEFRVGDYEDELGLIARRYAPPGTTAEPAGVIMYWHVDDVQAAFDHLLARGAKEHQPVTPRQPPWVTASVSDPWGNVIGLMHSPHYLEVLASTKGA